MPKWLARLPDGGLLGTFDLGVLQAAWNAGRVPREATVAAEGTQAWIPVATLLKRQVSRSTTTFPVPSLSDSFYVAAGEDVRGPVSGELLVRGVEARKLPSDALVLNVTGGGWRAAVDLVGKMQDASDDAGTTVMSGGASAVIQASLARAGSGSLVSCEDCRREVSVRDQTCPHCGAPQGRLLPRSPDGLGASKQGRGSAQPTLGSAGVWLALVLGGAGITVLLPFAALFAASFWPVRVRQDSAQAVVDTFLAMHERRQFARLDEIMDPAGDRSRARAAACLGRPGLIQSDLGRSAIAQHACACEGPGKRAAESAPKFSTTGLHEKMDLHDTWRGCRWDWGYSPVGHVPQTFPYWTDWCGELQVQSLFAVRLKCGEQSRQLLLNERDGKLYVVEFDWNTVFLLMSS